MIEDIILTYFNNILVKRAINFNVKLSDEDRNLITKIGIPNNLLDMNFLVDLYLKSKNELVIGYTYYKDEIILNLDSENIVFNNQQGYLAKSLENFIRQLYIYDNLWKNIISEAKFGNYYDNHQKYAFFLQEELLKIDIDLLKNDTSYFWGSRIEDINFGIV